MLRRVHRMALQAYKRLPRKVRSALVHFVAPSFSAGAMCVIEGDDGTLLLVRNVYRDHWGFPGGLLRRGEEPLAAARREVEEEVGVEIESKGDPLFILDPRGRRVDIVFRCRVPPPVPDEIRPASAEIAEVRWFPRRRLPLLQKEAALALARLAERDR